MAVSKGTCKRKIYMKKEFDQDNSFLYFHYWGHDFSIFYDHDWETVTHFAVTPVVTPDGTFHLSEHLVFYMSAETDSDEFSWYYKTVKAWYEIYKLLDKCHKHEYHEKYGNPDHIRFDPYLTYDIMSADSDSKTPITNCRYNILDKEFNLIFTDSKQRLVVLDSSWYTVRRYDNDIPKHFDLINYLIADQWDYTE